MKRPVAVLLAAVLLGAAVWGLGRPGVAGDPPENPEGDGLKAALAAYAGAFNKGDLDAVAGMWAEDAEYAAEDGRVTKGRKAIGELLKAAAGVKGRTLTLAPAGARFLRPDVALVDVTASFDAGGEVTRNKLSAVMVRSGDRWLISSVRDLPDADAAAGDERAAALKEVEWLVGSWASAGGKARVTLKSTRAAKGAYVLQEFDVTLPGGDGLAVSQRVGFDPLSGQLKSWFFDSNGGYGEGLWAKSPDRDNAWVEEVVAVLPDGRTATSVNTWERTGADGFVWRSQDRRVVDQALPDLETKYARAAE